MNLKNYKLILIHILAWAVCIFIPILIYNNVFGEAPNPLDEEFGISEIVNYTFFILFFYANAFIFIPKLFSNKKILSYVLVVIILILIIATTNSVLVDMYHPKPLRPFGRIFLYRILISLANLALSTSYRLIMDNFKREKEQEEKEKEKIISELSFLRSQISPHFIFNILNSIVSLVRKKSDQAEPVLLELSSLMRYMLYEADSDKVSIETVETYMTSYINLQKLRFGDDVKIEFIVEKNSTDAIFIEPMLFIPLIENAFKHGIGMIENPEIKITFTVNQDNIKIVVCNKYNNKTINLADRKSGIGLNNLRRRLELLYPEKNKLELYQKDNKFVAKLKIEIP